MMSIVRVFFFLGRKNWFSTISNEINSFVLFHRKNYLNVKLCLVNVLADRTTGFMCRQLVMKKLKSINVVFFSNLSFSLKIKKRKQPNSNFCSINSKNTSRQIRGKTAMVPFFSSAYLVFSSVNKNKRIVFILNFLSFLSCTLSLSLSLSPVLQL